MKQGLSFKNWWVDRGGTQGAARQKHITSRQRGYYGQPHAPCLPIAATQTCYSATNWSASCTKTPNIESTPAREAALHFLT